MKNYINSFFHKGLNRGVKVGATTCTVAIHGARDSKPCIWGFFQNLIYNFEYHFYRDQDRWSIYVSKSRCKSVANFFEIKPLKTPFIHSWSEAIFFTSFRIAHYFLSSAPHYLFNTEFVTPYLRIIHYYTKVEMGHHTYIIQKI